MHTRLNVPPDCNSFCGFVDKRLSLLRLFQWGAIPDGVFVSIEERSEYWHPPVRQDLAPSLDVAIRADGDFQRLCHLCLCEPQEPPECPQRPVSIEEFDQIKGGDVEAAGQPEQMPWTGPLILRLPHGDGAARATDRCCQYLLGDSTGLPQLGDKPSPQTPSVCPRAHGAALYRDPYEIF
ncbi:hypothetical protein SHKM778_95220 (plasmid) [Streptomyces sp. KM77-8]|uniref:Uncharacterized protein n=1 Tax=Streptomyces haneummycinicus TaxID=3074435 RepID=A0AAT9I0R6_9ACTN